MTPTTRKALEMAHQHMRGTSDFDIAVDTAITEALAEPNPRRLTDEDILDVWSKYNPLADWSYVGFGRAVEARIFGDVK